MSGWRIDTPDALPDAPVLYCSFPSLKDPRHEAGPDQHHTAEVVTFVPWQAFERWRDMRWMRRGAEYDELKARLTERLLDQFLERMPGLRGHLDHVELSTPLSTDFFTRAVGGSIYGLEPTPARFQCRWLRAHSRERGRRGGRHRRAERRHAGSHRSRPTPSASISPPTGRVRREFRLIARRR